VKMDLTGYTSQISSGIADATISPIILAIGILAFLLISLVFYIYFALAWSTIAKKLKYKRPWLAWIPFANISMMFQLGGFHWAWIFLVLIPVLGWITLLVLMIISNWRVFEKRKYPGWFSLSLIIPQLGGILYLIVIGFVAWNDRGGAKPAKRRTVSKKKVKKTAGKRKKKR